MLNNSEKKFFSKRSVQKKIRAVLGNEGGGFGVRPENMEIDACEMHSESCALCTSYKCYMDLVRQCV